VFEAKDGSISRCGKIEELFSHQSDYFAPLEAAQKKLLPEFEWNVQEQIKIRNDEERKPRLKIFVALCENNVAGFLHMNFIRFGDWCIANIDFLGVLQPYRRHGFGLALLRKAKRIAAGLECSDGVKCLGIASLADTGETGTDDFARKRLWLYSRLGGMVREDLVFRTPDYPSDFVVWYPLVDQAAVIPTIALARILWSIYPYAQSDFVEHIGDLDLVEAVTIVQETSE
jgi:GNAT superfamily N-acetyltransferase